MRERTGSVLTALMRVYYGSIIYPTKRRIISMRALIFEGTPEEMLRIPMFRDALRPQADGAGQVAIPGNATNGEPRDVAVQALLEKAPPRVVNFVKRVQSRPGVQVERGASVKLADGM